jgi:hypothetical protein
MLSSRVRECQMCESALTTYYHASRTPKHQNGSLFFEHHFFEVGLRLGYGWEVLGTWLVAQFILPFIFLLLFSLAFPLSLSLYYASVGHRYHIPCQGNDLLLMQVTAHGRVVWAGHRLREGERKKKELKKRIKRPNGGEAFLAETAPDFI